MRETLTVLFMALGAVSYGDVELDFSPRCPGAVFDRSGKELLGWARTETVYGRRLGDAMDVNPRFVYPSYAMDRQGGMNALRLGNALKEVPGSKPAGLKTSVKIPTGKPVTQLLWFYVYDQPAQNCNVSLLFSKFGWKVGFRCSWERAGWSPEGHVSCCVGIGEKGSGGVSSFGKNPDGSQKKSVKVNTWHQLALVSNGKTIAMYVDGALANEQPCGFYLDDAKGTGLFLSLAETSDKASFKTDFYGLYERALTAEEIAADWKKGQPKTGCDEQKLLAHWNSISIPSSTYGYFKVGERIPLSVDGKVVKTYTYDKPGLYEIEREGKRFPVGIVPEMPAGTCRIGMADLVNRQPEAIPLGVGGTVVRVQPRIVEPQKDEFDWTALDRFTDACAAKGVKVFFVPHETCSQKLRLYLGARYDNAKVVSDEKVFSMIGGFTPRFLDGEAKDKEAARKLVAALFDARLAGKKNVILQNGPTVWSGGFDDPFSGRPSWRGIAFAWYNARFGGKTVPTAEDRQAFLAKLDGVMK